ncbi:methylamine utilization protein [Rhodoferax mekongensis]|jgi:plastocyanin|uniref:Methylamine utilization protein n=1 Tax=Rhodoferax mekongensis TaxID=3068341 RepID=A0ABZ0AVI1_9BURK|nr:methylamine utilization protein [Rhodoferax sp. TBRC 17307]WNO03666.1 methylamine utilization protein [Rhodoferax sp. TBRC 17307]
MRWKALTRRFLLLAGLASVGLSASAAGLQVQVQDKNGKPLPNAVVFLESADAKSASKPLKGIEVVQAAKQFSPAVTVVTTGTSILFPNNDTVRHHVYSFSPAKTFDLKLYAGVPANPVVFDKSGIAVLGCNIHDNMVAWVVVVDTPYFGKTDAQGHLTIDAPAGSYKLRTWHASLPTGAAAAEQAQTVGGGNAPVVIKLAGSAA